MDRRNGGGELSLFSGISLCVLPACQSPPYSSLCSDRCQQSSTYIHRARNTQVRSRCYSTGSRGRHQVWIQTHRYQITIFFLPPFIMILHGRMLLVLMQFLSSDCAEIYKNEEEIGDALQTVFGQGIVKRCAHLLIPSSFLFIS